MRIILIGQAAFAEKTLEKLVDRGEEVVAVFCPPDAAEGRFDPVKQRAIDLGIPVHQHKSMKREQAEVVKKFADLNADLAILAFVTQIVPPAVFNTPKWGSICFHPSLLPKYRGRSAMNWALINGETTTGLTLFWVDEGIDTGPILLQKEVAVDPDDTTGTLYFNKIFSLGVDAIAESVDLIRAGNPPRLVQDESLANYDPPCADEHGQIDWSKPAQQIYNQIRGCDPQPGAHTVWRDQIGCSLPAARLQPDRCLRSVRRPSASLLPAARWWPGKCAAKARSWPPQKWPNRAVWGWETGWDKDREGVPKGDHGGSSLRFERLQFDQDLAQFDQLSRCDMNRFHPGLCVAGQGVFHFHGFEHHQGLVGLNLIALFDPDLEDFARHRRADFGLPATGLAFALAAATVLGCTEFVHPALDGDQNAAAVADDMSLDRSAVKQHGR
ncbi:MAG: methionyl-tRNA formyltransferase [Desulfurellaceae bacterium]|nr:methionyl-tRNA formyltransferase [Desulfurellaceae bacterium]